MKNWLKSNWLPMTIGLVTVLLVVSISFLTTRSAEVEPVLVEEVTVERSYQDALNATVIIMHEHAMTSGVIISPDGYVLSCAHGGAAKAVYTLDHFPGMEQGLILKKEATTIYLDRAMDLSIIKITDPKDPDRIWPYAPVSFLGNLDVGEEVFSVGVPLGAPYYLSWGRVIDQKWRILTGESYWLHSCSTNQGNSGGPLFNMAGEVVGINVFMYRIIPTTAGYVSLIDGTFAVDISDFLPAMWGLIAVHKNLELNKVDFKKAEKILKELERTRPD